VVRRLALRTCWRTSMAAASLILVTACSGAGSSAPSRPTGLTSGSSGPSYGGDVVAAFQAFLGRTGLEYSGTYTSTDTITYADADTRAHSHTLPGGASQTEVVSGSVEFANGDIKVSQRAETARPGDNAQPTTEVATSDLVVVGGQAYTRENGGQWQKSAHAYSASGFDLHEIRTLLARSRLVDTGLELRDGQRLHRLVLADAKAALDAAQTAWAQSSGDPTEITGADITLWVGDDGALVVMRQEQARSLNWQGEPATDSTVWDMTFAAFSGITITAPI
jgi:hypothetical protein